MKKFFKWLKWFLWDGGYFPTEEKGISEMLKRKPEPEEFPAYSGCINMSGSTHYGEDPDSLKLDDPMKGFGEPRAYVDSITGPFIYFDEAAIIAKVQPPKKKSKKKPAKKSPTKSKKKLARKK